MLRSVLLASDLLAEQGQVPESVVVAIENVDDFDERVRDLTPPGLSVSGSGLEEGGDRFLDFLQAELLPALSRRFRATAPAVLIGHSNGGILATYAAATRTAAFPFVVAIDTPTHLQDGWLGDRFVAGARRSPASPLRYASLEARFEWAEAAWSAVQSAAPSCWRLHREKIGGESHQSIVFLATYLGLRQV